MEVKKWEALLTADRLGSVSKAAEALGYTQSGMTYLLNRLEDQVGLPLLRRGWDGVRLTEQGKQLLPAITQLMESEAQLRAQIEELGGETAGTLCIGTYASISVHWIGTILKEFRKEMPRIQIQIKTGSRQELTHWLESGEVTLCISDALELSGQIWTLLYQDPLFALFPKDGIAPEKTAFSPEEEVDLPVLLPASSSLGGYERKLHRMGKTGLSVNTEDDGVLISMAEKGIGFCILPELCMRGRADRVRVLPVKPATFRALGVTRREGDGISPAVRILTNMLAENLPG